MPSNKTPKKSSPVGNEDIGCKSASKSATKGNYELGFFFFFILATKILKLALFQLPRMEIRTIIQFLVLLSQKIKMLSLRPWRITG